MPDAVVLYVGYGVVLTRSELYELLAAHQQQHRAYEYVHELGLTYQYVGHPDTAMQLVVGALTAFTAPSPVDAGWWLTPSQRVAVEAALVHLGTQLPPRYHVAYTLQRSLS